MLPSLDVEIRERLARYLAEEMPLSEFWDWIMPRTCYLSQKADQNTAALAYDIQLLLLEFSDGLWTEPALRHKLRLLARDYQATVVSSSITESLNHTDRIVHDYSRHYRLGGRPGLRRFVLIKERI